MFECCKRIWHWVRQATGKQKCHSPGKVSLRQPLPGYGGEGWKVCCMQAAALALSLAPVLQSQGIGSLWLLSWAGVPRAGTTIHSIEAHSSPIMNQTVNGFVSSLFSCQVLFSLFPTTGFVKPLLPQVPLAPGELLQYHQPYVAPLSFSGCRGGHQHIQRPPQHTHSDGSVLRCNLNVVAQHNKRAHPFTGLSQCPWRQVSPLSLLVISKSPNRRSESCAMYWSYAKIFHSSQA